MASLIEWKKHKLGVWYSAKFENDADAKQVYDHMMPFMPAIRLIGDSVSACRKNSLLGAN